MTLVGLARTAIVASLLAYAVPAVAQPSNKTVYLLSWGGSIQTMLEKDGLAEAFKRDTGYEVVLVPKATAPEMIATAIAQKDKPQIDVVFTEIIVFMQGVERGIFDGLTEKDIPNLPKMYDFAKIGDKGVAVVANVPVVFYREDMFKKAGWAPPTSFADLQRPELKGKIVIPGVNSTYGLLFLLELARLNGGDQYNIEPGFKALKAMASGVVDWTNTYAKVGEMMESQEAAISVWGTTGAWEIIDRGVPAKIVPPNPLYLSMSAVGMMKGAPNPEGARALVNWMMGDRHLVYRAERFGESPLNRETKFGGPHPERQLTRAQLESAMRLDHAHIRAQRAAWNERFAREIARQ